MSKNGMLLPTLRLFYNWKKQNILPKTLRMDNGGEKVLLDNKMVSDEWKIDMEVQWTPRDILQYNVPVEVGFATIGGRAKAMMPHANIPKDIKHLVIPEGVKTATKLDNIIPVKIDGVLQSRYKHFTGSNPPWVKGLRTFGKAGVVTTKAQKMHPKEADCGTNCLFIGY
jgi:hypothetical protein